MFRRKTTPAARRPHPNPRVEAELQRIISLRAAIARSEQTATAAAAGASRCDREAGRISSYGIEHCEAYAERAKALRAMAERARDEIVALHDEIAKRIAGLGDDDLLWLDPH